jgi:hypothetical protein
MQFFEFTLAERDNYVTQIEQQIQAKRNMLLEKRSTLQKTVKENQFLNTIKRDYDTYHEYILKQKQDQIQSMTLLHQYINDIIMSGKMTDKDISKTKKEQEEILKEIETIRESLDKIVNENQ